MENIGENETKTKKLTASAVLKEFNLTPQEAYEMLNEIYSALEKEGDGEGE
jgi:hypothetical protein